MLVGKASESDIITRVGNVKRSQRKKDQYNEFVGKAASDKIRK